MSDLTLHINGMTCGGCVRSVTSVLQGLDGVAKAEVSLTEGSAHVEYDDSKVSRDALVAAVEDAGFEVTA